MKQVNPATREVLEPLVLHHTKATPLGFLSQEVLGEAYYATTKEREIPGFEFGYWVATRSGDTVATVPYFLMDFKINTMLEDGWLKRLLGNAGFRMACIGHPCAAFGNIDGAVSEELMTQVFLALKQFAPVVSLKGFKPDMPAVGFVQAKGLPVAVLTMRENFWQSMSSARRRNIKRKRKKASALRFEVLRGLPDPYPQLVHDLYIKVHDRSKIQFERLDLNYFVSTAPISQYVLAYLGEELVGFVQTFEKDKRMVAQYIGIDDAFNRAHGIYFALAIRVVDLAIELGCAEIELGETHYEFKRALGCSLKETSVYFRHRNPWMHRLMSLFSFVFEPSEEELR
jgi:hypothetical protein